MSDKSRTSFLRPVVNAIALSILTWGWLPSTLILFRLLTTRFWWIPAALFVWTWWDRQTPNRGGRRWNWLRGSIVFNWGADQPITLLKTTDLSPENNYVFGYHPHGIIGLGSVTSFLTEAQEVGNKFPGLTFHHMTTRMTYILPIYRDLFMALGASNASRENIEYILSGSKGQIVVIVVGGSAEALEARPGVTSHVLKNRKGFVRAAIRTGSHLVPVYGFGENDLFDQLIPNPADSTIKSVQIWLQKRSGVSPAIWYGRKILGWLPRRIPVHVVVGAPIVVQKNLCPTEEEVSLVHEEYMMELQRLFNDHKAQYGYDGKQLYFI